MPKVSVGFVAPALASSVAQAVVPNPRATRPIPPQARSPTPPPSNSTPRHCRRQPVRHRQHPGALRLSQSSLSHLVQVHLRRRHPRLLRHVRHQYGLRRRRCLQRRQRRRTRPLRFQRPLHQAGNQGVRMPADGDSKVAISVPPAASAHAWISASPSTPPPPPTTTPATGSTTTARASPNSISSTPPSSPPCRIPVALGTAHRWQAPTPSPTPSPTGANTKSSPPAPTSWPSPATAPTSPAIPTTSFVAGTDTANPFGFVTYHAMTGTYRTNVHILGDLNQNGMSWTPTTLNLLIQQIQALAPSNGIPLDPDTNTWAGMPSNLQILDLTGNAFPHRQVLTSAPSNATPVSTRPAPPSTSLPSPATAPSPSTRPTTACSSGGTPPAPSRTSSSLEISPSPAVSSPSPETTPGPAAPPSPAAASSPSVQEANLGDLYSDVTLNNGILQVTGTRLHQHLPHLLRQPRRRNLRHRRPHQHHHHLHRHHHRQRLHQVRLGDPRPSPPNTTSLSPSPPVLSNSTSAPPTPPPPSPGAPAISPSSPALPRLRRHQPQHLLHRRFRPDPPQRLPPANSAALSLAGTTDNWVGAPRPHQQQTHRQRRHPLQLHHHRHTPKPDQLRQNPHTAGLFTSTTLPPTSPSPSSGQRRPPQNHLSAASPSTPPASCISPELLGDANADGHVDLTETSPPSSTTSAQPPSPGPSGTPSTKRPPPSISPTSPTSSTTSAKLTPTLPPPSPPAPEPASLALFALTNPLDLPPFYLS